MKQVLMRGGEVFVEDVPAPVAAPGFVVVKTAFSAISAGTELTGIKHGATPLWERALREPEKIKQAVGMAAQIGIKNTYSLIMDKLNSGNPAGYSLSGTVIETGQGVNEFTVGDRVACGGNKYAYHSEAITAPQNLVVKIPDGLGMPQASTATIGAIALQGVRRAAPTIGEVFCVIGLGILGQLTAQILKANGCVVIGTDVDPQRTALAMTLGMQYALEPEHGAAAGVDAIKRLSNGPGVDGVIITASSVSDSIISTAFKMCRKKGRVVLVGDVGLNLNRGDFYEKELDFFISASYGPGRYDGMYEEKGLDYPIGYVRWTENRNMSEFLRLVAAGLITLDPLISATFPLNEAKHAYEELKRPESKPLIILLSYPQTDTLAVSRVVFNHSAKPMKGNRIQIAIAGCSKFARAVHLPNLRELKNLYHLRAIMNRTGLVAKNSAKQFGAEYSTTDYNALLKDETIDSVLIATTHNLHAKMAYDALCAGKHVFVEKPLALTREELSRFTDFYQTDSQLSPKPILMVGFNRRFSPHIQKIKKLTEKRTSPLIITYRINGGFVAPDNWIQTPEGGGRNLGEACHIYDIFTFLTNSPVKTIEAMSVSPLAGYYMRNDNFTAVMRFEDGSLCTLTYTSMGSSDYPKERMEVFFDGKTVLLDDYKSTQIYGTPSAVLKTKTAEKGHKEELTAFAKAFSTADTVWPIEFWQLLQATDIALRVEELIT
ncbi:MAG: bi-domain-containing oxidoreductase [Nitrospirae bacterium]|nr:bi-domain-containing oxidoreductase [Nitrospirota bacterium]MBF0534943.1 bi-domain-containing oxidoreductase [Nitrospirota bacterium]MBF0617206.1 bi-domain-containing oxidoreductase [Nitrospirota bacterium]